MALLAGCARPSLQGDLLAASYEEPYLLAGGDRIRVLVFGQEQLSNSYAIGPDGRIGMPLIGPVGAAGATVRDLEGRIASRLRDGYLRDPRVSVEVETFRPFFILGEVNAAGQYPFVHGMTVQTAVAIAGGFAPRAYRHAVEITRSYRGEMVIAEAPMLTPLKPGDTITVKERYF